MSVLRPCACESCLHVLKVRAFVRIYVNINKIYRFTHEYELLLVLLSPEGQSFLAAMGSRVWVGGFHYDVERPEPWPCV